MKNQRSMMRFRMDKINVDQFAILTENPPLDGVSFAVKMGFSAAANAHRLACLFTIDFSHDERPLLKLSISCEFDVHDDDWKNSISDGFLSISKEDLGFFANQTVGTARGILYCRTENTGFRNYILPPINLSKILNEDLTINLSEGN